MLYPLPWALLAVSIGNWANRLNVDLQGKDNNFNSVGKRMYIDSFCCVTTPELNLFSLSFGFRWTFLAFVVFFTRLQNAPNLGSKCQRMNSPDQGDYFCLFFGIQIRLIKKRYEHLKIQQKLPPLLLMRFTANRQPDPTHKICAGDECLYNVNSCSSLVESLFCSWAGRTSRFMSWAIFLSSWVNPKP